jgi:cation-transporting ATPase E
VAAGATFAGFEMARQEGLSLEESRTVATLVLFGVAMWVLTIVARPLTRARIVLVAMMITLFVIVLSSYGLRQYFSLDLPRLVVCMAVIGIIAVAGALLEIGSRVSNWILVWWRSRH